MPSSFIENLFSLWLNENSHLFNFLPYIELSRKNYFVIEFTGITTQISCIIRHTGQVEVWIKHENDCELNDILVEFDIDEAQTDSGKFYCTLCLTPVFYDTREDLWIEHSFIPLAEWINNTLIASTMLCYFKTENQTCWIKLLPESEIDVYSKEKYFIEAVPALSRK